MFNYQKEIKQHTNEIARLLKENNFAAVLTYFTLPFQCNIVGSTKEDCEEKIQTWEKTISLFGKNDIEEYKKELSRKMELLPSRIDITENEKIDKLKKILSEFEIVPVSWKVGFLVYYSKTTIGFKNKNTVIAANSSFTILNQNQKKKKISLFWLFSDNQWKVTGFNIRVKIFKNFSYGVNYLDLS